MIICSVCDSKFKQFHELETHIENEYKDKEIFKCDKCDKLFHLQWRLKKHEQLHIQRSSKPCKYFSSKRDCPFEKLGCKFLHQDTSATEAVTESDAVAVENEHIVLTEKIKLWNIIYKKVKNRMM